MSNKYLIGLACLIAAGLIGVALWFGQNSGKEAENKAPATAGSEITTPSHKSLSAASFASTITTTQDAEVIDLRTAEEFAGGHLSMARNIDFYAADFRDRLSALDRDTPYFIYCKSGNRSGQTLSLMQDLGFSQVYNLSGGIQAWQQTGYALE